MKSFTDYFKVNPYIVGEQASRFREFSRYVNFLNQDIFKYDNIPVKEEKMTTVKEWRTKYVNDPIVLFYNSSGDINRRQFITSDNLEHLNRSYEVDDALIFDTRDDALKHLLTHYTANLCVDNFYTGKVNEHKSVFYVEKSIPAIMFRAYLERIFGESE